MSSEVAEVVNEICGKVESLSVEEPAYYYGDDDLLDVLYIKSEEEWFNSGKKLAVIPKDCKFLIRTPGKEYEDVKWLYARKDRKIDGFGDRRKCNISEEVLARRTKEIEKAKEKEVYKKYTREVPNHKRDRQCPRTPNKYQECPRRAWDAAVKQWKLDLYAWESRFDGTKENDGRGDEEPARKSAKIDESEEHFIPVEPNPKATKRSSAPRPDKSCLLM
uniref:SLBP_RNA_bind domain-containing protein n=1 Tax=Bursaphelenchus xylophilus TaxID=6326 RepID=A0A1I7SL80_BURXY